MLADFSLARLSICLCHLGRCGLAGLRQELLVLVVAPRKYFPVPRHGKALLVACVDLANLFVFQCFDLRRTVLNGDDLVFGRGMLAAVAVQPVDFDLASLPQAELAEVVPAPRVNLAGRVECDDVGASSSDLDDRGARVAVLRNEFDLTYLVLGVVHPHRVTCAPKDVLLAAEVVPVVVRVVALLST